MIDDLFDRLTTAYSTCEAISPQNVKMRAIGVPVARVGGMDQPFVHITIAMMRGVREDLRVELADVMYAAAIACLSTVQNVTLDIREMDPATYRKRTSVLAEGVSQ